MPYRKVVELERKHGDLHKVIVNLVNLMGQAKAAQELGVSATTINKWLKRNGYRPRTQYIHESEDKAS
jgi:transposase